MERLHNNPTRFVQVVENALQSAYYSDMGRWNRLHEFYESRYLNPDSPEKQSLRDHGFHPGSRTMDRLL